MDTLEIFVPVAESRTPVQRLAPRLKELAGARIALLDNMKANAGELLSEVANRFGELGFAFSTVALAKDATKPAPESIMAHLKTCDAVVLAIAD